MAFRSCTECLSAEQSSSNVSVQCREGLVDTGLTGYDAFNFMMVDYSDGLFCQGCARRVNKKYCPSEQGGRPNVGQEPIGGSMRSATGKKCSCHENCSHLPYDSEKCAMCCDRPDGFRRSAMMSATGEKGICDTDRQLTLHSMSIGIGAIAGLYLIPNKFLGAVGGMVAGGVLGGLILNSACQ